VPSGQPFSGKATASYGLTLQIRNVKVAPSFVGLSGAGLYQSMSLCLPASVPAMSRSSLLLALRKYPPSS
jgi:NAD/NADP transhydrogenase beta subunit